MNQERKSAINYVNTSGLSQLIEHYLEDSNVSLSRELESLDYDETKSCWIAQSNSQSEIFDGVILTVPASKVLKIRGNFLDFLPQNARSTLSSVQYSSR